MKSHRYGVSLAAVLASAALPGLSVARPMPQALTKPDTPEVTAIVNKAVAVAGDDYFVTTAKLQCGVGASPGLLQSSVAPEPLRIFDNVYFVGLDSVGAYAIKTSDGIILIDSLNNAEEAEKVLVPGLRKLGLDPAQIKYLVITHAHGDHYGGAQYLKEHFAPRLIASEADWKMMEEPGAKGPFSPPPARDMVAVDGQKLVLGDTTITLVLTPGHTPGTLSLIIPVKDKGAPHVLAMQGGTGLPRTLEALKTYRASLDHFAAFAAAAGADIELSNHPFVDDSLKRMQQYAAAPGGPNPLIIGQARYRRYEQVIALCADAGIARLQP